MLESGEPFERASTKVGTQARLRKPLVSLIVTNYNYERFVEDCLRSIVTQTYQDIEVIIVDDASTDNSLETIETFISSVDGASTFEVVALEENAGQMNAFVEGFRRAKGAFVAFVDADDYLFPEFVQTHVEAHMNPAFVAALTCSNEVLVDDENRLLASGFEKWPRSESPDHRLAPNTPVMATPLSDWRGHWEFDENCRLSGETMPLLLVEPDANITRHWIWSTTSAMMFRRGALQVILTDEVRDIRICADFYLVQLAHLLGGSLIIQTSHGAYRRHGSNNFASTTTIGRGVLAGGAKNYDYLEVLEDRIRDVFLSDFDDYKDLVGEPRLLKILSGFVPPSYILKVIGLIGWKRPSRIAAFIVLFVIRSTRRNVSELMRKLRFA